MKTITIDILLIEDSPVDVMFIKGLLKPSGDILEVEHVSRQVDSLARLEQGGIDVVVLDLCLPDSAGCDTCSTLRNHFPALPIVVLTVEEDEDLAVELACRGAQEYLLKDDVNRRKLSEWIRLAIERAGQMAFEGTTKVSAMKRSFQELIDWLGKETSFPNGAILLTGTGLVPPDDFTLAAGDIVHIDITGIGRLTNPVRTR